MIYVSGRVDVNNIDHYRSQFEQAKEYLAHAIYGVPVYGDADIFILLQLYDNVLCDRNIEDYMLYEELENRVELVKKCSRVYFLKGWEQDDMCRVEHMFAKAYNIPITYSKKF